MLRPLFRPAILKNLRPRRAGRPNGSVSAFSTAKSSDTNSGKREPLRAPTAFHSSSMAVNGKPDRTSAKSDAVRLHGNEIMAHDRNPVSYTHLRAHETRHD